MEFWGFESRQELPGQGFGLFTTVPTKVHYQAEGTTSGKDVEGVLVTADGKIDGDETAIKEKSPDDLSGKITATWIEEITGDKDEGADEDLDGDGVKAEKKENVKLKREQKIVFEKAKKDEKKETKEEAENRLSLGKEIDGLRLSASDGKAYKYNADTKSFEELHEQNINGVTVFDDGKGTFWKKEKGKTPEKIDRDKVIALRDQAVSAEPSAPLKTQSNQDPAWYENGGTAHRVVQGLNAGTAVMGAGGAALSAPGLVTASVIGSAFAPPLTTLYGLNAGKVMTQSLLGGPSYYGGYYGSGYGPNFLDLSGNSLMLQFPGGDSESKGRAIDFMLNELVSAIMSGNIDAIKTALTLCSLKAKTTLIKASLHMIAAMQQYDQKTKDVTQNIANLADPTKTDVKSGYDYQRKLAEFNGQMQEYSTTRQAIVNGVKDIMSMNEEISNAEQGYRRAAEQQSQSASRWV